MALAGLGIIVLASEGLSAIVLAMAVSSSTCWSAPRCSVMSLLLSSRHQIPLSTQSSSVVILYYFHFSCSSIYLLFIYLFTDLLVCLFVCLFIHYHRVDRRFHALRRGVWSVCVNVCIDMRTDMHRYVYKQMYTDICIEKCVV